MLLTDFDYYLPEELIAQHPLEPRDASRLLVIKGAENPYIHDLFSNLPAYLKPGDTLVLNDTKVIPARLLGIKPDTGAKAEVFLLSRLTEDTWEVLVRPGKKLRPGAVVVFGDGQLSGEIMETTESGGRIVKFSYEGLFEQVLDQLGTMPLPPYIKAPLANRERYQTVYARAEGSVAAPTAGLHFTPELLADLKARGIAFAYVTLHVGLGTFRPVAVENIAEHRMHREYFELNRATAELINQTREQGGRVISVGTTSTRVLETIADTRGRVAPFRGWTDIFIYPGYTFKVIDGLITNFHLPQSTLLMLVSALAGRERILKAYQTAVAEKYRFFSFGDAMLILP
ncbi:MAG: tRNA preQ1(34) S-adenosylmethionine ribosyltransferase-isomerase QueA [Bacillota bacterium]|nr:tRNA preQ1(34) S-adenosylmethionine ribosyltransferase-isomerase QueA [Bacillota bacterium]